MDSVEAGSELFDYFATQNGEMSVPPTRALPELQHSSHVLGQSPATESVQLTNTFLWAL